MIFNPAAMACNGCKHCWYSAPGGLKAGKGLEHLDKPPHVRCLFFKADIPIIVQKIVGCDGTKSPKIVGYEIPDGCPTVLRLSQRSSF